MDASKKFDKRLIERRIRKGELSREDLKAHLDSLEDKAKGALSVETTLEAVCLERAEEQKEAHD